MPIHIDEFVAEVTPPPAPAREPEAAPESSAQPDAGALAHALALLAWREARSHAD